MRVVVVGGGIAGLSLAAMLRRVNINCIVIEQQVDFDTEFQLPMILWSNALSCFRAFGLDQFCDSSVCVPEDYFGIRDASTGKWLLKQRNQIVSLEPMEEQDQIPSSAAPTATSHSLISRVLAEATKQNLADVPLRVTLPAHIVKHSLRAHIHDVRFGRTVVDVVPSGGEKGGANVILDNGHQEWADVVVGADGMHSTIRQLVYPNQEAAMTSRSQNVTQVDGLVKIGEFSEYLGANPAEFWGKDRSFSYYPWPDSEGNTVAFSATLHNSPQELVPQSSVDEEGNEVEAEIDPNVYRHVLAREFDGFGTDITRLCKNAEVLKPTELLQVPVMPSWHYRRATLIGDAAHGSFPSFMQQDASLCVEDAAILATCLTQVPFKTDRGYNYAFTLYEKARRARIERYIVQQKKMRNFSKMEYTGVRNGLLRAMPGPVATRATTWLTGWSYRGTEIYKDPETDEA